MKNISFLSKHFQFSEVKFSIYIWIGVFSYLLMFLSFVIWSCVIFSCFILFPWPFFIVLMSEYLSLYMKFLTRNPFLYVYTLCVYIKRDWEIGRLLAISAAGDSPFWLRVEKNIDQLSPLKMYHFPFILSVIRNEHCDVWTAWTLTSLHIFCSIISTYADLWQCGWTICLFLFCFCFFYYLFVST